MATHGHCFMKQNQSPSYEFILVCPTVAIITFGSVAFHLITLLPKTLINMTQDRPPRQAAAVELSTTGHNIGTKITVQPQEFLI